MPFFSTILVACVFFACVSTEQDLKIENSLDHGKLTQYNDSFMILNENLWETLASARAWQEKNFKLGDILIEDDQLVIKTKTGAFSKATLRSKFALRGDFDIQIDCSIDLSEKVQNMTQNLFFSTSNSTTYNTKAQAWIELIRDPKEAKFTGKLNSGIVLNGKTKIKYGVNLKKFEGSIRLVRKGKTVTMLYKEEGSKEWISLNKYPYNNKDQYISLVFANYFMKRKKINADRVLSGSFDNFKINAVHQIIESDI